MDRPLLYVTFETVADGSAAYFISITLLLLTVMSVERWLHMSRRSLITSRGGCFIAIAVLLIPNPNSCVSLTRNHKSRFNWECILCYDYLQ